MGALARAGNRGAAQPQAASQGRQYLTFALAGEAFAIAIANIREIIEYRTPTDVPMMPPFIRGVINLRGCVVPVIDLAVRFGRASSAVTRRTCIVILEIEHDGHPQNVGMVVDSVSAVLEIADADVEPPPSFGARLRADFMTGMGKIGERFVIILDTARVLSIEELSALAGLDAQDESAAVQDAAGS